MARVQRVERARVARGVGAHQVGVGGQDLGRHGADYGERRVTPRASLPAPGKPAPASAERPARAAVSASAVGPGRSPHRGPPGRRPGAADGPGSAE